MIKNHFKIAWRNLVRNKLYSTINIAGLGIGLTAVLLILLYITDERSFDRFHANADRIYRIVHDARNPEGQEEKGGNSGAPEGPTFYKEIPEVENFCRIWGGGSLLVRSGEQVYSENASYVDDSFFEVFSFPLLKGTPLTVFEDKSGVILSKSLALKYFNGIDVIGKTIVINIDGEFKPFQISGVAADAPLNSSIPIDILLPISIRLTPDLESQWLKNYLNTFVVLKEGTDVATLDPKLEGVFNTHVGELFNQFKTQFKDISYTYRMQPLTAIHTDQDYNVSSGLQYGSNSQYAYILGGIALFILVIASINFINLSMARAFSRGKEISMRKINGSSRFQLIMQFLIETLVINTMAFFLAFALASLLLPTFSQLANVRLELNQVFSTGTISLLVFLLVSNTFITGFYPAFVLSGFNPIQSLQGKFKFSGKYDFGKALITLQFVMAVFFISGTLIMQSQFGFIQNKKLGYHTSNILTFNLPWDSPVSIDLFKNELQKYGTITNVAAQSNWFDDYNNTSIKANNRDIFNIPFFKMDENALPLLKIAILEGRNFYDSYSDSTHCLVNRAMIAAAGWENPIGQKITTAADEELTVIGVVEDFHTASLKEKIQPLFIHQAPSLKGYSTLLVEINAPQKSEAIRDLHEAYNQLVPYQPLNYSFLDDLIANQYKKDKRWKDTIALATVLAIVISCIGLFGLTGLAVEQRTKEIGIRKVLGASVSSIVNLLSKDFVKLVLIAILIASPLAWWAMSKWLEDFAYKIEIQWWMFALAGLGAVIIALLTVSFQAIKAAVANPVDSLRDE